MTRRSPTWTSGWSTNCKDVISPINDLNLEWEKILGMLSGKISNSSPTACQDWAATKAVYRFLDNVQVSEQRRRAPSEESGIYLAQLLIIR